MDRFSLVFEQPVVQCLGLVLLHFVWQGVLVAICLACGLRLLRRKSANVHYVLSVAALVMMAALPVGTSFLVSAPTGTTNTAMQTDPPTFGPEQTKSSAQLPTAGENPEPPVLHDYGLETWTMPVNPAAAPTSGRLERESEESVGQATVPLPATAWGHLPVAMLPWVVSAWALGVCVLSFRLAGGWFLAARLKWHGTRRAAESLQQLGVRLSRQLGVRRSVAVLESTLATVPCLIGVLRPTILLPASALTGLSPEQLESILAHELAHVRRHDCLIILIQALVEILLFYHPGVWWVSHRIRVERENCCDDLALSIVKNRLLYAEALAATACLIVRQSQLTAAADGASLSSRIRRILGLAPVRPKQSASWWVGALMLVVLASSVTAVSLESMVRLAQAEETKSAASDTNTNESHTAAEEDSAADDHPFRIFDGFDGKLALDWEILRPDPTHASLEKNPGKLTITSQFGGFHADANDVRGINPGNNQYMIPVPQGMDDFVVTTCLEDFHPNARHQQAGPVIYDDHDNYFKALIGVGWGDVLIGSSWEDRTDFQGKDIPAHAMKWDRTWLRITKRGKAYEASYSFDGKEYTVINERVWGDGTPQRIGLVNMNENGSSEPIDAVFDFIEVRALTAEERNNPAHDERQKFFGVWEIVADPDGRRLSDSLAFTQFTFNGTWTAIVERQNTMHPDFSVHPDTDPKSFSLLFGDRGAVNSSYRFEGDQLVICMNTHLGLPAPSTFEPGIGRKLIRLRRMPAAKAKASQRNGHSMWRQFRMLDMNRDNSVPLAEFLADRPTPESIQQGKDLFAILDRDGNGKLAYMEYETWPRKATHLQYDLDADGVLSEEEFALGEMKPASLDRALRLFRLLDRNGDGQLDATEFMDRSAEAWFVSFDSSEDNSLSYEEYAKGLPALAKTDRCRIVFDAIDADSNGSVSRDEYVSKAPKYAFAKLEAPGDDDGEFSLSDYISLE